MKKYFALIAVTFLITSCAVIKSYREETANRIASSAFMVERDIQAGPFSLRLYERIHDRGGVAHIYIEGDDVRTGINNTPSNPISLRLAAQDKAKNVIYIARPCQYEGMFSAFKQSPHEAMDCNFEYTTTHRFAPSVIKSYNITLDEIKKRWGITTFRLYGHSGGGAIAAHVAKSRPDVISLTTINAPLDFNPYAAHMLETSSTRYKTFKGFSGSLNAFDIAPFLKNMPQHHYYDSDNTIMPILSLTNYLQAVGPTNCVQYTIVPGTDYTTGWTEKWPEFVKDTPSCKGPVKPIFMPAPVYVEPAVPETPDNAAFRKMLEKTSAAETAMEDTTMEAEAQPEYKGHSLNK